MTGVRYRDEILDGYVRPYAGAVGPEFILMDDNARPHRARVVEQYLEQETIVYMDWPARSPNLNPIEHVWNMLQVVLSRRRVQLTTLAELGNALVEECNMEE
jgi:transposase